MLKNHFKTEASCDSRESIGYSKKASNANTANRKSQIIKKTKFLLNQHSSEIDDRCSDDDIPVVDKLRMNIGQMNFDRAKKIFPLKLNITNEDEYILSNDDFFVKNPQLKEFANMKLMKKK